MRNNGLHAARRPLRAPRHRAQVAGRLGPGGNLGVAQSRPAGFRSRLSQELRARDAAVSLRRAPHGPSQELHDGGRPRALPAPPWRAGAAPDGLRRIRPAGGEPRDQDRRAPCALHRQLDRRIPSPVPLLGHLDRLAARVRNSPAGVLPLDAVDLPKALRARSRLSEGGAGQVVPARPDRAGERAGDRRRAASAAARRSWSSSSSSGFSRSPTTRTACWRTSPFSSRGPSG